jgi:type IV secretory pathway TraG/TraD family ATPase VirD4
MRIFGFRNSVGIEYLANATRTRERDVLFYSLFNQRSYYCNYIASIEWKIVNNEI